MQSETLKRNSLLIGAPFGAVGISVLIAALILLGIGSNPFEAFSELFKYATRLEITIEAINNAVPLYLSAVAVAIGFRMNLFNIGIEGQYILAAILGAYIGSQINLPAPLHILVILLAAMASGAAWSGIAGVLKAYRGVHEVISTIMMNAISISFVVAVLLSRWNVDPSGNQSTPDIPKSGLMPNLNRFVEIFTRNIKGNTELQGFLIVAICVGIIYWIYTSRTRPGYDLRITGINPLAAQASGVNPKKTIVTAMLLSGAVGGLIGFADILGDQGSYDLQFVQGLGFMGITVALLGLNHPGGIAIAAMFIGYLDAASPVLHRVDDTPQSIIQILQGIIIFVVVITYAISRRKIAAENTRLAAMRLQKSEMDSVSKNSTPEDKNKS